jgi:UDP-sulfoquinovose synthase
MTSLHKSLANRFDYDGIYGTVLNRFIVQAASGIPLSVYGSGGQSRAFIHIEDTAKCVQIALENDVFNTDRVRIFNQVSEVKSVLELATIISQKYGSPIDFLPNPRKELDKNDLIVSNDGLTNLGFDPIKLSDKLLNDVTLIAAELKDNVIIKNVNNSPKW